MKPSEDAYVGESEWSGWIGRRRHAMDWIIPSRVAAWNATLDRECEFPNDGEAVPLGFHWTLSPPVARESSLGPDGHPARGEFLPPIPLPRRMWAGSRLVFHRSLRVGELVERESVITGIEAKHGRSGALVFVTVSHRLTTAAGLAVEEAQDLVYRDPPASDNRSPEASVEGARTSVWGKTIHPSETLLFRYSALTFNGHRVHYDRRYAEGVEGYPGLVVHGPLIATLLLELVQTQIPASSIARFQFKALGPTFDVSDFRVCGGPGDSDRHFRLWSTSNRGEIAIEAEAWMR